jgi:hypothetical protein
MTPELEVIAPIGTSLGASSNIVDPAALTEANTANLTQAPFSPVEMLTLDAKIQSLLDAMARELAMIAGRREQLSIREAELVARVAAAKGRLLSKPEVDGGLLALQKRVHERSVGAFESMLTAITDDVIPNPTGGRRICLDLQVKRDMPALDIYQSNAGKRETITSGAMQNVVGTGLRFIVIARSGMRPFILLDEADCWIEDGNIHNFFNVIHQLSRDAGIQTVLITHHASEVMDFSEDFRIYHIDTIESKDKWPARKPNLLSAGNMWVGEGQEDHLAWVEAKDFEGYPDARMEFSPGVTAIVGPNEHGKSAWVRMFKAAFQGEGKDDIVRHDCDATKLAYGFSDGRVLEFNRFRKGTPKANFILHSPDSWAIQDLELVPALHNNPGTNPPAWIAKELGMGVVDGVDAQLWGQENPVFMLNETDSKRASLLSIGRESGYLYAMNQIYKEDVSADNKAVTADEKEILANRTVLKATDSVDVLLDTLDGLRAMASDIIAESQKTEKMNLEFAYLEKCRNLLSTLVAQRNLFQGMPVMPEILSTSAMTQWMDEHAKSMMAIRMRSNVSMPAIFNIERTGETEQWLAQQHAAEAAINGRIAVKLNAPQEIIVTADTQKWLDDDAGARLAATVRLPADAALPLIPDIESTNSTSQWLADHVQATASAAARCPAALQDIPAVLETASLQALLDASDAARRDTVIARRLPKLPSLPIIESTAELSAMLQKMREAEKLVSDSKKDLIRCQKELVRLEELLSAASEVLGEKCPLCENHIDVDALLGKQQKPHKHTRHAP